MPACRASAATEISDSGSARNTARASRRRVATRSRRRPWGVSAEVAIGGLQIEIVDHAAALLDPRDRQISAFRVKVGSFQESQVSFQAGFPDRLVTFAHREVRASDACALRAENWIGLFVGPEAGRRLPTVETVAPVADAEPDVGIGQQAGDVGIEVAIVRATAERRSRRK